MTSTSTTIRSDSSPASATDDDQGVQIKFSTLIPPTATNTRNAHQWGSSAEFFLSALGYAVGLGNVWRFPNMVCANGGGAFLIPYALCLIFIAIPLLLIEAALGQYSQQGPVEIWNMAPLFRGCGIAAVVLTSMGAIYYNAPIAWSAFYFISSMNSPLPWTSCGSWATQNCTEDDDLNFNSASDDEQQQTQRLYSSPAEEYFFKRALKVTSGLTEWGSIQWELLISNLVVWLIIFLAICKGSESLGKAVYFTTLFPYFMLTALLAFTATLPGAGSGVRYYLEPDASKLMEISVWRSAVSQVFFSTSVASGAVTQMAANNNFKHNIVRDVVLVALLDGLTSFYAGFGVFTVLGYMAHQRGVPVEKVVESGPGLIFITYPEALAQMPGSAVWSCLFFFMICILGLSSQFPAIETISASLTSYMPWTARSRLINATFRFVICMVHFICGTFFFFGNGYFSYFLVDERVIGYPLMLIGLVEAIGVSWFYGTDRLMQNIEEMTGPWRWKLVKWPWIVCWKVIAPSALFLIFIMDVATTESLEVLGYEFPFWSLGLAGFMLSVPLSFIPIYAAYKYCRECGGFQPLMNAIRPMASWPNFSSTTRIITNNNEQNDTELPDLVTEDESISHRPERKQEIPEVVSQPSQPNNDSNNLLYVSQLQE